MDNKEQYHNFFQSGISLFNFTECVRPNNNLEKRKKGEYPLWLAAKLSEEAGEVNACLTKKLDDEELAKELADLLIIVGFIVLHKGFSWSRIFELGIRKLTSKHLEYKKLRHPIHNKYCTEL